jgi:molybdopterin biosynthesis enzyme
VERNPGRDELVRGRLTFDGEGPLVEPLPGRESHMIARAALADALVLVRRGEDRLRWGDSVEFLRLS